jgi:hypothetical protein
MQTSHLATVLGFAQRLTSRANIAAVAVVTAAAPLLAQSGGKNEPPVEIKPPTPGQPDSPPMVWNVLLAVVIIGLIVGVSMIPSKRGHQD